MCDICIPDDNHFNFISLQFFQTFFKAMMIHNSAPDEAQCLLDELSNQIADELRQLVKKVHLSC